VIFYTNHIISGMFLLPAPGKGILELRNFRAYLTEPASCSILPVRFRFIWPELAFMFILP